MRGMAGWTNTSSARLGCGPVQVRAGAGHVGAGDGHAGGDCDGDHVVMGGGRVLSLI